MDLAKHPYCSLVCIPFQERSTYHLPKKLQVVHLEQSKSKDAKARQFIPTDNSKRAFPVSNQKEEPSLKDLVPNLPSRKRRQDLITVHPKNLPHYTPPLQALEYEHSNTHFNPSAGQVDEVNLTFNKSMPHSIIATNLSGSPSTPGIEGMHSAKNLSGYLHRSHQAKSGRI